MSLDWETYLTLPSVSGPGVSGRYQDCIEHCAQSFAHQRKILRRAIEATRPKRVACLGAGVLNDIPFWTLVRSGAIVHLVDWLPGVVEAGLEATIIRRDDEGGLSCIYCDVEAELARSYCRNCHIKGQPTVDVCDSFEAVPGKPEKCQAFERGEYPFIHLADITGGYAENFARRAGREVAKAGSWKEAFRRGLALAKRSAGESRIEGIPDHSVDLVTSSMVITQFDVEPYGYFSKQAEAKLGTPGTQQERRLRPALAALRERLWNSQFDRHVDEILRILTPEGHLFIAFELYQLDPETGRWFLVEQSHRAIAKLAERFDFNHDIIPTEDMMTCFKVDESGSLVSSFVLVPRHERQPRTPS